MLAPGLGLGTGVSLGPGHRLQDLGVGWGLVTQDWTGPCGTRS